MNKRIPDNNISPSVLLKAGATTYWPAILIIPRWNETHSRFKMCLNFQWTIKHFTLISKWLMIHCVFFLPDSKMEMSLIISWRTIWIHL
jgi:hypothetical protein